MCFMSHREVCLIFTFYSMLVLPWVMLYLKCVVRMVTIDFPYVTWTGNPVLMNEGINHIIFRSVSLFSYISHTSIYLEHGI